MSGNTNRGSVTAVDATGENRDNVMAGGLIGLIDAGGTGAHTVITSEGDMVNCAVKSDGRAGALFAAIGWLNTDEHPGYNPKATFTNSKVAGSLSGKLGGNVTYYDEFVTIDGENFDRYHYSYSQGGVAELTVTGLEFWSE